MCSGGKAQASSPEGRVPCEDGRDHFIEHQVDEAPLAEKRTHGEQKRGDSCEDAKDRDTVAFRLTVRRRAWGPLGTQCCSDNGGLMELVTRFPLSDVAGQDDDGRADQRKRRWSRRIRPSRRR